MAGSCGFGESWDAFIRNLDGSGQRIGKRGKPAAENDADSRSSLPLRANKPASFHHAVECTTGTLGVNFGPCGRERREGGNRRYPVFSKSWDATLKIRKCALSTSFIVSVKAKNSPMRRFNTLLTAIPAVKFPTTSCRR